MKLRECSLTALLSITHPVADVGEDPDVGVEGVRGDQLQAEGLLPVDQHALGHADREKSEPNLGEL